MTTLTETFVPKSPPLRENAGGVVMIEGTRVPLDTIIWEYWNGLTAEEIALAYDTVGLADVHAVLGYYLKNREKVDDYLEERARRRAEIRAETEAKHPVSSAELAQAAYAASTSRHGKAMIRFLADENFDGRIYKALGRRVPSDCIVRVQDVGIEGAEDPVVLEWAAHNDRVVLTHDVTTMTKFAYDRVAAGLKMPGVFEMKPAPFRLILEDLVLIALCSEPTDWKDQVRYIPL